MMNKQDGTGKVFGVGFSKTGTTSLEKALGVLGYDVCIGHWQSNHTFYQLALYFCGGHEELIRQAHQWDAFADGPWGGTDLYKTLVKEFPNAKYVLTERDADEWYVSFEKLVTMFDTNLETALESYYNNGLYGSAFAFEKMFDIKQMAGNKDKIIAKYTHHNLEVKSFFEEQNIPLLNIDFTKGIGWEELCPFLGKDIPEEPFPHANRTKDNPYITNMSKEEQNSFIKKFAGKLSGK